MRSLFTVGSRYSRKDIWSLMHPGQNYPVGGNWSTGYVQEGQKLFVFANIGTAGRTGHDFPNTFDADNQTMIWFGKPNSHSAQPTFKKIFEGSIELEVFVRWDSKQTQFTYLGNPYILRFEDGIKVTSDSFAIKVELSFRDSNEEVPGPDGSIKGVEGGRLTALVNKYERDPALRAQCIDFFGPNCQICGFSYFDVYGEIGKGFCHVHHLKPLSEVGEEHSVDPISDLIPVCANCHSMLHRTKPVLSPEELRKIIKTRAVAE
jgi:5-methylcytosine-specific restriction protein A